MNKTTQSIIMDSLNSAKEKNLLREDIGTEETTFHLIAITNGVYRLYFTGIEFYQKKENVKTMIYNYINLIFKQMNQ